MCILYNQCICVYIVYLCVYIYISKTFHYWITNSNDFDRKQWEYWLRIPRKKQYVFINNCPSQNVGRTTKWVPSVLSWFSCNEHTYAQIQVSKYQP